LMDAPAGFLGHTESSGLQLRRDVFACGSYQGDLKIVNDARSIQRQT
jgi:hypothetical protein